MLANAIGDAGGAISAVDMHTVARSRCRSRRDDRRRLRHRCRRKYAKRSKRSTARESSSPPTRPFSRISAARFASSRRSRSRRGRTFLRSIHPASRESRWPSPPIPAKAFQRNDQTQHRGDCHDGTAVLGLGDIRAVGALPVMEGKRCSLSSSPTSTLSQSVLDTKNVDVNR